MKNFAKIFYYFCGLGIILIILHTVLLINYIKETEAMPDKAFDEVDLLVVLTGGSGRIDEGVKLLSSGKGELLFISGGGEKIDIDHVLKENEINPLLKESIIFENLSKSTYENALMTKEIVKSYQIKSIALITSAYHIKRASYTFRRILPEDVKIYPYRVKTSLFKIDRWYKDSKSRKIIFSEFYKYHWYRLRFLFGNNKAKY